MNRSCSTPQVLVIAVFVSGVATIAIWIRRSKIGAWLRLNYAVNGRHRFRR